MTPDIDLDALTADATEAVETLRSMMATNSRDWGAARDDAWFYGLVVGWGRDPDDLPDPDDDCGDAMPELAARHGWSPETVSHLRRMHDGYVAVPALLSALTATRAELETAKRDVEKLTTALDIVALREIRQAADLAIAERGRNAARQDVEYWKGKYEAGVMDQLAATAPQPDEDELVPHVETVSAATLAGMAAMPVVCGPEVFAPWDDDEAAGAGDGEQDTATTPRYIDTVWAAAKTVACPACRAAAGAVCTETSGFHGGRLRTAMDEVEAAGAADGEAQAPDCRCPDIHVTMPDGWRCPVHGAADQDVPA